MKTLLTIIIGALIYYISFHGAIGVYYDIITLYFSEEKDLNAFLRSTMFDDIAAFNGFVIPTILSSTFIGLFLKEKPPTFGVILCGIYSIILWAVVNDLVADEANVRVSDVVAPIISLSVAWLTITWVRKYA